MRHTPSTKSGRDQSQSSNDTWHEIDIGIEGKISPTRMKEYFDEPC